MKHATGPALDRIENLLQQIRGLAALSERKRGIFYLKAKAFLHFHEDPVGIFADVRCGDDFERLPANSHAERKALIAKLRVELSASVSEERRPSRRR